MRLAVTALLAFGCLWRTAWALVAGQVNVTSISGTWSSGHGAVTTGPSFINPLTYTFTFPSNTGISFSFTDDGHFEEAQFRYAANSTRPHCVTAYLIWQHGTYTLQPNGSITTQPIAADGRIQVQNRCEAMSSVITYYNQPGLYQGWQITNDQTHNQFMLQMTAFDNSLMPRLYLAYRPPQMWSTSQLTTNQTSDNYQIANGAALGITGAGAAARPAASQLVAALGLVFGLVVLAA